MAFKHVELLVPSIIAQVLALYPLPWHIRTKNIATLSMIFWMSALNLVHNVNSVVWDQDAEPRARVWGDISVIVIVGYNFALPTSHLLLAKQLESLTSLRPHSPLYDDSARRRHRLFDLCITFAAPTIGVLVHLSNMDRRYYVVESYGPLPSTYWNGWGVFWMAVVPIIIAAACAAYTAKALYNIVMRRKQMLSMIATGASVNKEQFVRLMFLTMAELGTCGLRAIFNLMSFHNGPQPLGHLGPPIHNLTTIESIPLSAISARGMLVMQLSYFTVIACSYIFFLCFVTSAEVKRFYGTILRRLFPCLPEPRSASALHKLGSMDTGLNSARIQIHTTTSTHTSPSGGGFGFGSHSQHQYDRRDSASGPASWNSKSPMDKEDMNISLEDMLGTPQVGSDGRYYPRKGSASSSSSSTKTYDEEAVHLPPMLTENDEKKRE
ncbi:pheromone a factor receptor [Kwoniella heveanensis CBS 569]|nr:pheromone a factor receptor [Kwoniella heveanensis CBS 569]